MKSTSKSKLHLAALPSKHTDAVARIARRALEDGLFLPRNRAAREQVLELERKARRVSIFDRYFSIEQQAQINRLQNACDFEGATESEAIGKTIATLAAAALFMFGLDPIARDAFDRVSSVVYGDGAGDEYLVNVLINEHAGEEWTRAQRGAELGEPQGAKADEAAS